MLFLCISVHKAMKYIQFFIIFGIFLHEKFANGCSRKNSDKPPTLCRAIETTVRAGTCAGLGTGAGAACVATMGFACLFVPLVAVGCEVWSKYKPGADRKYNTMIFF